jgi:epoxyqueuosine reductase
VKLSERIKAKAHEFGLDKVGIVPAEPLAEEGRRLVEWLEAGFHGEMSWMEREPDKRADPRLIFADAKSVIVAAVNYFTPHEHYEDKSRGKLSRYAWGNDYHDVVREKLTSLLDWIKSDVPDANGKICVDTAPVMDKAWAVRAGIGWLGKHSNVITTEFGSWIFIGEIILNLELDYEKEPVPDHCGSCTACLDACPTNAIVEPYWVDSRKCISYATIELRSPELPESIAHSLNGWIYGCDICQDVCPWNRFEKPTNEPLFEPRKGETSIDLDEMIGMQHATYTERFRRTAIKRAKLSGLQRNAKAAKYDLDHFSETKP